MVTEAGEEYGSDPAASQDLAFGGVLLGALLLLQGLATALTGAWSGTVAALLIVGAVTAAASASLRFWQPPVRVLKPLALAISLLALAAVLGRSAQSPSPASAVLLPMTLVASSMLYRSARWYTTFVAVALVAWGLLAWQVYGRTEWEAASPSVLVGAVIGLTMQFRRQRILRRIAEVNAGLRRRANALESAYDEASRSREHLAELSVRDPLTGAYNRRYLEQVQLELERPTAHWGCLMLDLDQFKLVNDRFGHEEGDRVLQGVAHFLRRQGRAEDRLVRVGGDEFVFIMDANSEDELHVIADRVERVGRRESPCPFTVGRAFREPSEPFREVLQRADADMYRRKGESGATGKTLPMRPRGRSS